MTSLILYISMVEICYDVELSRVSTSWRRSAGEELHGCHKIVSSFIFVCVCVSADRDTLVSNTPTYIDSDG